MSATVIVNGWRQQTSDRRQVLRWLAEARQLGFTSYSLHRIRNRHWLCCIDGRVRSGAMVDIAVMLQQQFKSEPQLLYLQFDPAQIICVSWRDFELRNCLAVANDEQGLARFRLLCEGLCEQVKSSGESHGKLIVAGRIPVALTGLISALGTPCETMPSCPCLEDKVPAAARFSAISKSPHWQRHRLWMSAVAAVLCTGIFLAWQWWPAEPAAPVVLQAELAELPGLEVGQIMQLQYAMHHLAALAGWRLQQLTLAEQGLQASMGRTYGLNQELIAQLDKRWQSNFSNDEALLQMPLAEPSDDPGAAPQPQDYQAALRVFSAALPDYLPSARLQLAETGSDAHWRWQNLTLNIPDLNLPHLELLALLLRDAPARLLQAHIEPGPPARSTIQLQFIARQQFPGGSRP